MLTANNQLVATTVATMATINHGGNKGNEPWQQQRQQSTGSQTNNNSM